MYSYPFFTCLSIEPFLELKHNLAETQFRNGDTINRTIFGIETALAAALAFLHLSINRTIFGIETVVCKPAMAVPELSIEPFLELKRYLVLDNINRAILSIEPFLELKQIIENVAKCPITPINRTIFGIETHY